MWHFLKVIPVILTTHFECFRIQGLLSECFGYIRSLSLVCAQICPSWPRQCV